MTSRRQPTRRDFVNSAFCHVATSLRTSRRRLVTCSLTSRRCPSRHDVGFITLCHVATSPRTSRRCPVLSLRTVHFWLFTSHTPLIGTLAFLRTSLHRTCRSSHPPVRGPSIAFRPPLCITELPSPTGSGSLWHSHHIVLDSGIGWVF